MSPTQCTHCQPPRPFTVAIVLLMMAAATLGVMAQTPSERSDGVETSKDLDEATTGAQTSVTEAQDQSTAAVSGAGLRVFLDPETGEVTSSPSQGQIDALLALTQGRRSALSRSSIGLEVFPLEGGGIGIDLEDRFQSATVIRIAPDGTQTVTCVTDAATVETLLDGDSPEPTVEHDHDHGATSRAQEM